MNRKRFTIKSVSLFLLMLFLLPATILTACSDDEVGGGIPEPENLGRFEYSMRDSQDLLNVKLTGVKADVSRIESSINWVSIEPDGTDSEGNVQLKVTRVKETPANFVADSAYVYVAENKRATLVLTSDEAIVPLSDNADAYADFHREWWKQEEILYSTTKTINGEIQTVSEHIPLPWAPASTSNIPTYLFSHDAMTTNEGWVMAYDLFAAETNGNPNSKPYFMLYNKYTGMLRTFYYQKENAGSGGEFSFVVTPDDAISAKYPFYSSMQYAIPLCNKDVQLKGNVLNVTRGNNSFQQMVTPYLKADVALKPGWYCFDLDLSAYNTQAAPFLPTDRLSIDCMTANNTNITLAGTITGETEGNIEGLANSSTSTSNGMNYLDKIKSGSDYASEALTQFLQGNYLKAIFRGALSLWNYGKALTGNATDDYTTETESTGNINMSFTGKMNLEGYSTSNTSNNAVGVEFSYTAFSQSNLIGQGVWGLQDNPVVYVVKDRLIGEDEDLACNVTSEGYNYGVSDPAENNLRLITFFDPTSIHFNIRTSLYKNISNVKMSWVYGVYPNQEAGHTDPYRIGLMDFKNKGVLDEPEFIDRTLHQDTVYKSFSSDFANMKYVEYPLDDVTTTSIDESTSPKIYKQNGADYRYYAQPGNNLAETDDDFFLVDPLVFLPTTYTKQNESDTYGTGMFYDFVAPDFVVGVTLTFDYTLDDGTKAKAVFTKRFLPEVKAITTAEMLQKRTALQQYVNGGVHQTVNGVTIKHEGAAQLLKQFFSTSDYISKYDN